MFALLVLGLALWTAAHLFKRLAPDARAGMGDAGKAAVAVGVLAGLVLMILGYRGAEFISVWYPPAFLVHINNLLMLIAVFVFGMSATTGRLRGKMRHPQLTSVKIWAVAHLLVNGDLASIVLFGGLLAWAVAEVIVINRSVEWDRPAPGEAKGDVKLVIITLVVFAGITAVHNWLGVWPFPG
ncbi:NnrU family protein [Aestuariicoccus sp. MJ-SS9]|uniref:NnrU family protein n=1 Tax=Aestuariicoccus sp. MJ-SS9 TaxID=3079855 RepID=UPI0029078A27|nr:NnrU family protein [Aestuariicoccus sp. MJ-SS9]MDU8911854.1 NnrU family protein [Aestuariicoccus sp. MJ-SS9]